MMNSPPARRTAEPTTLIVLLFWAVMLHAAALWGAVLLAPKYAEHIRLKEQVRRQQRELLALEQSVVHHRRIAQALTADPATAAEQLRADFRLISDGEEAIAVDPALMLAASDPAVTAIHTEVDLRPWYFPIVERLATWRRLRYALLTTAALLTVLAFGCLQESQAVWVMPLVRRGCRGLQMLFGRYYRPAPRETPAG